MRERTTPGIHTHRGVLALVAVLGFSTLAVAGAGPALAASDAEVCATLTTPIAQRGAPDSKLTLLTATPDAAEAAGYTVDLGTLVAAAVTPADGLVAIRYLSRGSDNLYIRDGGEADRALTKYGYDDSGVAFYASADPLPCTVPVFRYRSGSTHRQVSTTAGKRALEADGWTAEGVSFYAAAGSGAPGPTPPSGTDTVFTIAVEPDTQGETNDPDDTRFRERNQWLADRSGADDLDLRFVTHTGDVVNWDTDDHAQYKVATKALVPLEKAGIPFSLSIGNHDTMATGGGNGGSARDPKNTKTLVRVTKTFNSYFTAERFGAVGGVFEAGKIDNSFSRFTAGGADWLVLNLELWPRVAAVNWAKGVVADHPKSNVLVVTHSYLESAGSISQSAEYGATSPQYLFDNLISQYANIKLVFSGHTGVAAARTDTGVHGNKIRSLLAAIHSRTTNPVRIVEIDTAADTMTSTIVAPRDSTTAWRPYDLSLTDMGWITD